MGMGPRFMIHRRNCPFDWTLRHFAFLIFTKQLSFFNKLFAWLALDCIILPKSQRRIWIVLGLVSCPCYQTWWKYIYSFKDIRYAWCMHQFYCLSQQRELVRYYILFFHRICILQMNHVSHNLSTLCYLFMRENIYVGYTRYLSLVKIHSHYQPYDINLDIGCCTLGYNGILSTRLVNWYSDTSFLKKRNKKKV